MLLNCCVHVLALRLAVWILNQYKTDWELLLISLLFTAHYFDLNGIIPTYLSCQSCSFLCFWYSVKHPHSSATQSAPITCYSKQSTWFCCTWIAHFPFESASILSALFERFLLYLFFSFSFFKGILALSFAKSKFTPSIRALWSNMLPVPGCATNATEFLMVLKVSFLKYFEKSINVLPAALLT